MIRQIAPQFFTTDIPRTMAYYKDKLGFECLGTLRPIYRERAERLVVFQCTDGSFEGMTIPMAQVSSGLIRTLAKIK